MSCRVLAAVLVVLAVARGSAVARGERGCEEMLAAAGRSFLERALAVRGSCARAVARGRLPPTSDCGGAATARARDAAARLLAHRIRAGCSPGVAAAFHAGGDCAAA